MRFLMAASVGPVQGFIAAARKTRDLYAGSWILSEVAKAVAKSLVEAGAELVFPSAREDELKSRSTFAVSNKILAVVDAESPGTLATQAKQAAKARVRDLCGELQEPHQHDGERLLEHVDEMLEFYAAWVPLPEGADYKALYREVEELLNARKTTRAFPPHQGRPGLPKSSLDGMRESILPRAMHRRKKETDTRVDDKEELDGTGFLKRFVKLDRVKFDSVRDIAVLPYRGKVRPGDDLYYAILMADGDAMGKAISQMGKDEQQRFSKRLSTFADTVRKRLDDDLECMPVFAGGDELIAMVPLHQVVRAVETVHKTFLENVSAEGGQFTMSAGIAIIHEMEPLDEARAMAHRARKQAKDVKGKNALCITEAPRSGAPVSVSGQWDWMLQALNEVVAAYSEGRLSYGFGHELWDVLKRTPKELDDALPDLAVALARHKQESNSAAKDLVERNKERLDDLMGVMLVARKVARACKRAQE